MTVGINGTNRDQLKFKKKITQCNFKWQDVYTKNNHTYYATTFFGGYFYFC